MTICRIPLSLRHTLHVRILIVFEILCTCNIEGG
jgi:hypothetical protein